MLLCANIALSGEGVWKASAADSQLRRIKSEGECNYRDTRTQRTEMEGIIRFWTTGMAFKVDSQVSFLL